MEEKVERRSTVEEWDVIPAMHSYMHYDSLDLGCVMSRIYVYICVLHTYLGR